MANLYKHIDDTKSLIKYHSKCVKEGIRTPLTISDMNRLVDLINSIEDLLKNKDSHTVSESLLVLCFKLLINEQFNGLRSHETVLHSKPITTSDNFILNLPALINEFKYQYSLVNGIQDLSSYSWDEEFRHATQGFDKEWMMDLIKNKNKYNNDWEEILNSIKISTKWKK